MGIAPNRRILLIDDMPTIHQDFRKILAPASMGNDELSSMEAELFGDEIQSQAEVFELDCADQGETGLAMLEQALAAQAPYALAFVDMRMPPGWDGVQTIEHLWRADPRLQVVICTAYSDYAWDDVITRLDVRDRLLVLKKPFDAIEVSQLASTLLAKWDATLRAQAQLSQLEAAVALRTAELSLANTALQAQIIERKQLQVQLVHAEKLACVGQLAAGMAHEINNPISFISSNFTTLDSYVGQLFGMLGAYEDALNSAAATDVADSVQRMRQQVDVNFLKEDIPLLVRESRHGIERVRKIVQDLRDFSRVDSSQDWQQADLHQGIDSTLNLLAGQMGGIDIVKDYGTLPTIECLPREINQMVMNLLLNAIQAIGTPPGRLSIRTGLEGQHVWMEIADTGVGISPTILDRIFEPFFTTRPVGTGTGLGLALCYGIVRKHRGTISVENTEGEGSTFRVMLPVRVAEMEEG